jgi:hypothetical protein
MNPERPNLEVNPAPLTRQRWLHGAVQRIIKYYLRRDCEKCVSRLGGTYEIAWHYSEEAAHKIKKARFLLTDSRDLMR